MTIPNSAPDAVSQMRDRLLASLSVVTLFGIVESDFYYPRVDGTVSLPHFVLERSRSSTRRVSAGGVFVEYIVTAVLHVDADVFDDGLIEKYVDAIATEIASDTSDGIFVSGVDIELCSDPSPGMYASSVPGQPEVSKNSRSITFIITCGDP